MNEDIVPGLLANIEDDFKKSFQSDDTLKTLYGKVQDGTATQADGEKFAYEVGKLTREVFHRNVTPEILPDETLYYNIANRIIPPILSNNYEIVCEVMKQVIEHMNRETGIGIKFQKPEMDTYSMHNLIWAASLDKYEKTRSMVENGVDTHTRRMASDCVKTNAKFQHDAGINITVTRDDDGDCCEWCADLAGSYDYGREPKDFWAYHDNCGCTMGFDNSAKNGYRGHTKDWTSETAFAMMAAEEFIDGEISQGNIEARKRFSHAVFKTKRLMSAREFALKMREIEDVKSIPRIRLDKKEYAMVVSAMDTYIYNGGNPEREKRGVIHKEVRDHIYTVVNHGFGDYEIIGKEPID